MEEDTTSIINMLSNLNVKEVRDTVAGFINDLGFGEHASTIATIILCFLVVAVIIGYTTEKKDSQ